MFPLRLSYDEVHDSYDSNFLFFMFFCNKAFVLQAEPPTVVVSTLGSLCQMLERKYLRLENLQVLVIDEVS